MNKKILCLFLAFVICFCMTTNSFASGAIQHLDNGVNYIDITETKSLTSAEISKYNQYNITTPYSMHQEPSVSDILNMSRLIDTKNLCDLSVNIYSSSLLPTYLYACSDVIEILEVEGSVYITYRTVDNETVYLTFTNEGLVEQIVYDSLNDTVYMLSDEENTKIVNFRYGSYEIISDELLDTIQECIISKNYSEIQNNPSLSIDVNELGQVIITPSSNTNSRSGVIGFTNENDMLENLEEEFPMLNNTINNVSNVYCAYFDRNISFRGVDNRSDYVRVRADHTSFAASTLLNVIAVYLTISTGGVISILDALGIGITIIDGMSALENEVELYRSANYKYYFQRYGLLYDTTRYDDYVEFVCYRGFGTFCGGYDSNEEFTWIRNPISTPETVSWSEIQETAIGRYNTDLYEFGYCERYYPMGWFNY